jgi:hypothetical protein
MQKFQDVVLDSQGRPVAGAVIAVQEYPGGGAATVYETDAVGAAYTPTTDAFGAFFFYAPNGNYSYTVTVGGVLRKTVTDVEIVDSIEALALKAPLASPTFTGTVVLPSATSIGSVSATELGYLDGVTSAIQTQFTGKASVAAGSWTPTFASSAGTSSFAYTSQDGYYVKLGSLVVASGRIVLDSGGTTLSGNIADKIRLASLPFAGRSGIFCAGTGNVPNYAGFGGATDAPIGFNVQGGLSYANIFTQPQTAPIFASEMNGATATVFMELNFCITYITN